MGKKRYAVRVPICGYASVEVDAESEDEAIDAALESVTIDDIEEWEPHRIIAQGNFFHGNCNEADAMDVGDADE